MKSSDRRIPAVGSKQEVDIGHALEVDIFERHHCRGSRMLISDEEAEPDTVAAHDGLEEQHVGLDLVVVASFQEAEAIWALGTKTVLTETAVHLGSPQIPVEDVHDEGRRVTDVHSMAIDRSRC
jgi:hypothetical protein